MGFGTVLFDLDGTLTESAPGILHSIRIALEKMGRPIPDEETLNKFIGPPLIDSFQKYCGLDRAEAERALVLYREYYTEKGLFENSVYAGVVEMLRKLGGRGQETASTGCKILLATAKPEVFARRILDHFDLTRYFDAIHGATLDETRNRKAGVIAWALTHSGALDGCERSEASEVSVPNFDIKDIKDIKVGDRTVKVGDRTDNVVDRVDKIGDRAVKIADHALMVVDRVDKIGDRAVKIGDRAVMVGDRADDILGARANGLDSIGVLYGYGSEAELREAGATYIAATPDDVVRIVLGLNREE